MNDPVGGEGASPRPQKGRPALGWLGHSTCLLELDGKRILTDPLLRRRVAHLTRSAAPALVPRDLDAILVSHAHRDHFDPASLRLLPKSAVVVVPVGLGRTVAKLGFDDVVEIRDGDRVELTPLGVAAVHAEHAPGRDLPGRGPAAVGYVIAGSHTVYFAGDTDVFDAMTELAGADLALLPIGGWGPRTPPGHLDPSRAAQALALLRPRACVPVHYGTYRPFYRGSPYPDDAAAPTRFAAAAHALAPEVQVHVLRTGDFIRFG